jgi:hypothetical protein
MHVGVENGEFLVVVHAEFVIEEEFNGLAVEGKD